MRDPEQVAAALTRAARRAPEAVVAVPGRLNLVGEHTDHTGGLALPLALAQGVVVAAVLRDHGVAPRDDGVLHVRSRQAPDDDAVAPVEGLAEAARASRGGWGAYALGAAAALQEHGVRVPAADLLVDADLPVGAGLASSAALTVGVVLALAALAGRDLPPAELVAVTRRAENVHVGAPTGVLDQLAVVHGRAGAALLVDAQAETAEPVPLPLDAAGLALLVVDTGAPHAHAGGGYADRRERCEAADRALGAGALRTLSPEELAERLDAVPLPPPLARAARHVVGENARVRAAVTALRDGADPRTVGPLLSASHASLRDDLAVSTAALDLVVRVALEAGAHGARMTGGGFGGCALALVDTDRLDAVADAVVAAAQREGHPAPSLPSVATLRATPSAGARRLR